MSCGVPAPPPPGRIMSATYSSTSVAATCRGAGGSCERGDLASCSCCCEASREARCERGCEGGWGCCDSAPTPSSASSRGVAASMCGSLTLDGSFLRVAGATPPERRAPERRWCCVTVVVSPFSHSRVACGKCWRSAMQSASLM